jgi:hypothetical protein
MSFNLPYQPMTATRLFFRCLALWLSVCLIGATHTQAQTTGISASEKSKIEALITHLEKLPNATFIRNGSDYDAPSAGKFLRGKWQAHEGTIHTAADFIAQVATVSFTTGKPYLIRFSGQPATPCADYLRTRLRQLETDQKT